MTRANRQEVSRREALRRLGTLALGAYVAPSFTTLSIAEAKGSSSSGSGGSSGSSGSGSGNSGSGSNNSGSGSGSSSSSPSGPSSSGPGSAGSGSSGGKSASFGGNGVHIQFADGHTERIRNGRYERLDQRGRVIEGHAVRRTDIERLRRLGTVSDGRRLAKGVRAVIEIDEQRGLIEITDYRGWRETVSGSTYELRDPNGRAVTRRPLTAKDIFRIRDTLYLD